MLIRTASTDDLPAILAIYNEVIANSTAVYMDQPVTLANRVAWHTDKLTAGYPLLVAEEDGAVAGFSSFGDFRSFPGYRFTVEHSLHLAPAHRGKGLGKELLEPLFSVAKSLGKHAMLGAIDAENAPSIRFHEKLGFVKTAHMPQVGYKFGRWLDVVFMQKLLTPPD